MSADIANAVCERMFARDRASQSLGIEVPVVGPGTATLTMLVRADMCNGFEICHGGLIATLADSAFAFACNSHNEMTVASGFSVDFIAPAFVGNVLTAVAKEVALAGRTGVYDVEVRNQHDELIAVFRGNSYRIKGRKIIEDAP